MAEYKHRLLETTEAVHDRIKERFNTSADDPHNQNVKTRSDELPQNAVTGLFLVLNNRKWTQFPMSMKVLWILCILVGSVVQWTTTWLLYLYIHNEDSAVEDNDTEGVNLLSALMACVILFVYVFQQMRRSFLTLWHYFPRLEFGLLHYWILFMLIGELSLEVSIAVLSTLAIQEESNISDQLGICLAFFFILELSEWIYGAFIQDFDVLQDDDFILKTIDPIKTSNIQDFYHKKALAGIVSGVILLSFCGWVVIWFYVFRNS